jgi:hypothetical protein
VRDGSLTKITSRSSPPVAATSRAERTSKPTVGTTALRPSGMSNHLLQSLYRRVTKPDEPIEREADRMAEAALTTIPAVDPAGAASRLDGAQTAIARSPTIPQLLGGSVGGSQPLDSADRSFFEERFGTDFSGVRLHSGLRAAASARALDALAFTSGRDIVFADPSFSPNSAAGRRLLAHELSHVAQQQRGAVASDAIMRQAALGGARSPKDPPSDEWRLLGAEDKEPAEDEIKSYYLVHIAGLDQAIIAASTVRTDSSGPEPQKVLIHPAKGEVARVLIHSVGGMVWVYLYAPKGGRAGGAPSGGTSGQPGSPTAGGSSPPTPASSGLPKGAIPPIAGSPTFAPGAQAAAVPSTSPPPLLSITELQARLRLIEAALKQLADKYRSTSTALAPIQAAQANIDLTRRQLVGSPTDVERITTAEHITDRLTHAFEVLDAKRAEVAAAPGIDESRTGYFAEMNSVQNKYFQALGKLLLVDQVTAFNAAEQAAQNLPRQLIEVDLKRYETRPPTYQMTEPARKEIVDWVGTLRTDLDALQKLTSDLVAARQANAANVPTLEAQLNEKAELIQLSIEAIGHWDRVRAAFEYLADQRNLIYTAYSSIGHLNQRCLRIKAAAKAGNLADLRAKVTAYRDDPNIAQFYRGLPLIAFGSRFLVSLAIALVATLVTAGVAGLVTGGAAASSTAATATGITARGALAFAGTAALEALTFTAVSTSLNYALLGQKTTPGKLALDLLWNLGLFGTLRGVSAGVGRGMKALGTPALTGAATTAVTLPLLQGFGILRFRLEEGRWMTQAEMQMAGAETIIMAAALALGTAATQRWIKGNRHATELARFQRDYGFRFTEIEAGRQRLIDEVATLVRQNRADDKAALDDIRARAQKLEDIFSDVVKEIEGKINLTKLRDELVAAGHDVAGESSAEALAKAAGIDVDVGLRRAGGERTFTYAWGKTKQIEARLRTLQAQIEKTTDDKSGLVTVRARFGPDDPLVFQERSDPIFGEAEVEINPSDPRILAFMNDLGISDASAKRTIINMITAKLARSPKQTLDWAISQVKSELRTREKTKPGTSIEALVLEVRAKGIAASGAPDAVVAAAVKLAAEGFLASSSWKTMRTLPGFLGVLAERLGLDVFAVPKAAGGRVFTNVRFVGDVFTDPAGTTPRLIDNGRPVVDTDVSELDYMGVSGTGSDLTVESMGNVKGGPGKGGQAATQNKNALSALKGHISGKLVAIQDGGTTFYARVKRVEATDSTNKTVNLSGVLKEAPHGMQQETIGPRAARGYDRALPFTEKELQMLVNVLREMQMKASPEY